VRVQLSLQDCIVTESRTVPLQLLVTQQWQENCHQLFLNFTIWWHCNTELSTGWTVSLHFRANRIIAASRNFWRENCPFTGGTKSTVHLPQTMSIVTCRGFARHLQDEFWIGLLDCIGWGQKNSRKWVHRASELRRGTYGTQIKGTNDHSDMFELRWS
jgi:hypothetical protein